MSTPSCLGSDREANGDLFTGRRMLWRGGEAAHKRDLRFSDDWMGDEGDYLHGGDGIGYVQSGDVVPGLPDEGVKVTYSKSKNRLTIKHKRRKLTD